MVLFNVVSILEKRFATIAKEAAFAKTGFVFGFVRGKEYEFIVTGICQSMKDVPSASSVVGVFGIGCTQDELKALAEKFADVTNDQSPDEEVEDSVLVFNFQDDSLKKYVYGRQAKTLSENDELFATVEYDEVFKSEKLVRVTLRVVNKLIIGENGKFVASENKRVAPVLSNSNVKKSKAKVISDFYSEMSFAAQDEIAALPAAQKKKYIEKEVKKLRDRREPMTFLVTYEGLNSADINNDNFKLIEGQSFVVEIGDYFSLSDDVPTLNAQLQEMETQALARFAEVVEEKKTLIPQSLIFYDPEVFPHIINEIYAFGDAENEKSQRERTHLRYFIPMDRPHFGANQAIGGRVFKTSGALYNPHKTLPPALKDGIVATVSGKYLYYHYTQHNMADSGWGCAYRSLQTIVSWFQLQGYVSADLPTHSEIQKALVACGDKPETFVGSSKWIGSQEVSFVLSQLYSIQSKIMFVPSGADLAGKARELIRHFEEVGTPIMIGGGVLAHTIAGIHFNESNGDVRFLVLDPHYTGADDLATIHKKGFVAWKPLSFWSKSDFYNLCMPQLPNTI